MTQFRTIAAALLATGAALAVTPAAARPPEDFAHRATVIRNTSDGSDCYYFDANGATEPNQCRYHIVIKTDAAGKITTFNYQDHGSLNPGQALPTGGAFFMDYTAEIAPGQFCEGTEVLTPDGRAYSDCEPVK